MNVIGFEKLELFSRIIDADIEKSVADILNEARENSSIAITATERSGLEDAYKRLADVKKSIYDSELSQRSQRRTENRRSLLLYRESLIDGVFAKVREKLTAYTETKEYFDWLNRIISECKNDPDAVLFLSKIDLEQLSTDCLCRVESTPKIALGGAIIEYPQRKLVRDLSFDNALSAERAGFGIRYAESMQSGRD